MIFSSTLFLFYFLPLVLLVYYLAPKKAKNPVLFLFSLVFYAWGEPIYIAVMLFSVLFNYFCGLALDKRKNRSILVFAVVVNLGILLFFKYTDFFIGLINGIFRCHIPLLELALPIGISFYTFQTLSYVIDVYRGKVASQKNLISFGTYVALFPQLIAGPIVRYSSIEKQLSDRTVTAQGITSGIICFIIGLSKKVLIANQIGLLWDSMHAAEHLSVLSAWLGIIAFAFQIYFDFSGYSDMAIGLGKLFGFTFDQNFHYPYTACSITDFWRRWHISLSTWFKEYVYIPLGGNRVSPSRTRLNLLIVWGLTGFWHGASLNFILWGLYYALLLILEKERMGRAIQRLPRLVQTGYTLFFVLIGWVFFASDTLPAAFRYLGAMFGLGSTGLIDAPAKYALGSYKVILLIAFLAMLPAGKYVAQKCFKKQPLLALVPMLLLLFLCLIHLADASYNPFLYFRF
ncbi:MAG: MBOAT family O-acyltransferase [Clostridia bacterium]|nr:MBOAT family O-acyltransferase [Clostridia bacterium]